MRFAMCGAMLQRWMSTRVELLPVEVLQAGTWQLVLAQARALQTRIPMCGSPHGLRR